MIRRDPEIGFPITVTDISAIDILEDTGFDFSSLRGAIKWQEGDESAEETIRRIRNGL